MPRNRQPPAAESAVRERVVGSRDDAAQVLTHAVRIIEKQETEAEAVQALLGGCRLGAHTCCKTITQALVCAACAKLAKLLQKQRKRGGDKVGDETYRRSLSRAQDHLRAAVIVHLLRDAHARTAKTLLPSLVRHLMTGAGSVVGADFQIRAALKAKLGRELLGVVDAILVAHGTPPLARVTRKRGGQRAHRARRVTGGGGEDGGNGGGGGDISAIGNISGIGNISDIKDISDHEGGEIAEAPDAAPPRKKRRQLQQQQQQARDADQRRAFAGVPSASFEEAGGASPDSGQERALWSSVLDSAAIQAAGANTDTTHFDALFGDGLADYGLAGSPSSHLPHLPLQPRAQVDPAPAAGDVFLGHVDGAAEALAPFEFAWLSDF